MGNVVELFYKPKVIALVGDTDSGKSHTIYTIIDDLKKQCDFNLVSYGLKVDVGGKYIHSVYELEQVKNSVIILDEVMSLWDLEDRKTRKLIERTIRLIFHNNNVLLLSFIPENMKKFISAKVNAWIFKKITVADLINGSRAKSVVLRYHGAERGSEILNIPKDKAIVYHDDTYELMNIQYNPKFDTKKDNEPILKKKV